MDQRGVRGVSLVTTDHNLPKVAEAVGVPVPGLNDLAAAFRLPGGIGDQIERIGSGTLVVVSNVITTTTGRMVFANPGNLGPVDGAVAIVLAAGRGERMDSPIPKALMAFDGATVVARAVQRAAAAASVSGVVVVAPPGFEAAVRQAVEGSGVEAVVPGGETRQASVVAGLSAVAGDIERILCHDAARPLASPELFERTLEALEAWDGVVPVLRVIDTVKRVQDGRVEGTEPRDSLALAQTPQAFRAAALRDAHGRAAADGFEGSDDALLLERAGYRVRAIEGERTNLKITTPEDIRFAEALAR